jgi:hypothetical protein
MAFKQAATKANAKTWEQKDNAWREICRKEGDKNMETKR